MALATVHIRAADAPDFAGRYQRDYNIYAPMNCFRLSNPSGGVNSYDSSRAVRAAALSTEDAR